MEFGGGRLFIVISIKQSYAGHAKQALLLAAGAHGGNYIGRFVVVVDEDIHPGDLWSVMWAISSRGDPVEDIDIIRNAWSGPLEPRKRAGDNYNARALNDACRAYHGKNEVRPRAGAAGRGSVVWAARTRNGWPSSRKRRATSARPGLSRAP